MAIDINTITEQEKAFLKFMKDNWVSGPDAFSQLEQARNQWRFWVRETEVIETPEWVAARETEVEDPTLWSEIIEAWKEALTAPLETAWWIISWAVSWISEAPWISETIEKKEEAAIAKQREAAESELWRVTESWVIIPKPLDIWVWALQEVTAPLTWTVSALFGKALGWLTWAARWALQDEQKQALDKTISAIAEKWWELSEKLETVVRETIWNEAYETLREAAKATGQIVEPVTEIAWVAALTQVWKEALLNKAKANKAAWRPETEWLTRWEVAQLKQLKLETVPWKIWDVEVQIPKPERWVVETLTKPVREKNTKVLAWRALSPRTTWKSAKQKLKAVSDVEKNAREFHKNIRTWVLEWDISTIEDAAQAVVSNLDTVWERIWNAVKQVEWNLKVADDILWEVDSALKAKWASVSPATPILTKFKNDIAWDLSIDEAFELKKAYQNEVSKLYKAWDAWTKQYKALSDWVKHLNSKIDDIIENQLWAEFAEDKKLFKWLKEIVDDLTASALVEWRRAPNTLAEQIWMIEWILSPVDTVKQTFIKEIAELNTRWWSWQELIKLLDEEAIKAAK